MTGAGWVLGWALARSAAWAGASVAVEGLDEDGTGRTSILRGVEVVVMVRDARNELVSGETVRVIHRPGLAGERELAIGISDGRGRVRWTPEVPGVALLRAGDGAVRVLVEPDDKPIGIVVLLAIMFCASAGSLVYGWWGPRGVRGRGA